MVLLESCGARDHDDDDDDDETVLMMTMMMMMMTRMTVKMEMMMDNEDKTRSWSEVEGCEHAKVSSEAFKPFKARQAQKAPPRPDMVLCPTVDDALTPQPLSQ